VRDHTGARVRETLPLAAVQEWVAFMKKEGIQRVVSMLTASELETYAEPGLQAAMQVCLLVLARRLQGMAG
jgi:hypothetical protein